MSTFLCDFENSIVNLWNNQNLRYKCLTVIGVWTDFLSPWQRGHSTQASWLKWPWEASVQRWEKTFHPCDPSARAVCVAITAQEQGGFLCTAMNSMPIQLPPLTSLCSSPHLQLDLISPVLFEFWRSKSGLVGILGTINNASVNAQTRKVPYTEVTLG